MTYMTEPQNDGKNFCEPHRWAIMPALPLCYGRADADFDSPFACVVCDHCENDVDGNFSGPCECDRVFHSWIGVYEERIIERKEALLRVYARENHALRNLVRKRCIPDRPTRGTKCVDDGFARRPTKGLTVDRKS